MIPLLVVFVFGTAALLSISRASLRNVGSHGFYRFFAFEAILGLILLNVDSWFTDPFSVTQIVSWILLLSSLVVLGFGVYQLRTGGQARHERQDGDLLEFEKTTALVTSGIYRHIRHPLYASLLLLAWGTFLKDPQWVSGCLGAIATAFLIATAKADERECIRYFGSAYEIYMKKSAMFIPFVF